MQGRQAFGGGQIHRKFVILYQDLKTGKLAFLGCEVDGCEALRSGERRKRLSKTGAEPTTRPSGLGLSSVPVSLGGVHSPLSPLCFQMSLLRVDNLDHNIEKVTLELPSGSSSGSLSTGSTWLGVGKFQSLPPCCKLYLVVDYDLLALRIHTEPKPVHIAHRGCEKLGVGRDHFMTPRLGGARIGQTRVSGKAENIPALLHRPPAGPPAYLICEDSGSSLLGTFKFCSVCRAPPCAAGRGCSFLPRRPLESKAPVLRRVVWLLRVVLAVERRRKGRRTRPAPSPDLRAVPLPPLASARTQGREFATLETLHPGLSLYWNHRDDTESAVGKWIVFISAHRKQGPAPSVQAARLYLKY